MCRIRNEQLSSSVNKGNKRGGSKSPMGHYLRGNEHHNGGQEEFNDRSPERSYARGKSANNNSALRRGQNQY